MRLNQRHIEIFNAIMVHKSVTAAASSLGTSQPTVSRELRELEKRIGFDLFDRFGKRLTPTSQAQQLHSAVARSFVGMEEISRVATAIKGNNAAHIRVACLQAYAEAFLPEATQRFLKRRSQVHLLVHSLEEVALQHDMTTQLFDIGLTEGSHYYDDATTEKIEAGDLLCVLPAAHALTAKNIIEPGDLHGIPFVYYSEEDPYRRKLDSVFDAASVVRHYTVEITTAAGLCSMVAAGVGVSIVNPFTAAHYIGRGIVLRKLSFSIPYHVYLWRPTKRLRSALADEFVRELRQTAEELTQRLQVSLAN